MLRPTKLDRRVMRIGNLAADSALARVATVISHENEWFLRATAPRYVMIPEIVRQGLRLKGLSVGPVDRKGGPVPESWQWHWG